jgi:uncharacterized protein (DUF433 family)
MPAEEPVSNCSRIEIYRCAAMIMEKVKGNRVNQFERITFAPQIMGGRACIRGMRIPVSVIVKQIAHGADREQVLVDYPDLQAEDIQQALEYAAWLSQEEIRTA